MQDWKDILSFGLFSQSKNRKDFVDWSILRDNPFNWVIVTPGFGLLGKTIPGLFGIPDWGQEEDRKEGGD